MGSQYWTSKGNKRVLERDSKGRITDNKSWKNMIRAELRTRSKAERLKKIFKKMEALMKEAKKISLVLLVGLMFSGCVMKNTMRQNVVEVRQKVEAVQYSETWDKVHSGLDKVIEKLKAMEALLK